MVVGSIHCINQWFFHSICTIINEIFPTVILVLLKTNTNKPRTEWYLISVGLTLEFAEISLHSNDQLRSWSLKCSILYMLWKLFFILSLRKRCRFCQSKSVLPAAKLRFNICFWNFYNRSSHTNEALKSSGNLISFSISIHFQWKRGMNYEMSQVFIYYSLPPRCYKNNASLIFMLMQIQFQNH